MLRKVLAVIFFLPIACLGTDISAQRGGTALILIPGARGAVPHDFLMRNKRGFESAGLQTVVAESSGKAVSAAHELKTKEYKVVIVGMSKGAQEAASAIASGAPVNGVVFVSAGLRRVASQIQSAPKLPATLIVHHRHDACRKSRPRAVRYFQKWSGGKARVRWITTTGRSADHPCGPSGAHGFFRKDREAVSAIVSFAKSR